MLRQRAARYGASYLVSGSSERSLGLLVLGVLVGLSAAGASVAIAASQGVRGERLELIAFAAMGCAAVLPGLLSVFQSASAASVAEVLRRRRRDLRCSLGAALLASLGGVLLPLLSSFDASLSLWQRATFALLGLGVIGWSWCVGQAAIEQGGRLTQLESERERFGDAAAAFLALATPELELSDLDRADLSATIDRSFPSA